LVAGEDLMQFSIGEAVVTTETAVSAFDVPRMGGPA
jgi:hypothetical protein